MRYSSGDFVDPEDVARAKGRSPHARQICKGSMLQVNDIDGAGTAKKTDVACPICLKTFSSDRCTWQKNGAKMHPILPSHMPSFAGMIEAERLRKKQTTRDGNPRPY